MHYRQSPALVRSTKKALPRILAALVLVVLSCACAATRYAEEQGYINQEDFASAEASLLKKIPLDAQAWAMVAECRFHLRDFEGMLDAGRKSLALSGAYHLRVAHYYEAAYTSQLKDALNVLASGHDLEASKQLNLVIVFGDSIPQDLCPQVFTENKKVSAVAAATAIRLKDYPQAKNYLEGLRDEWKGNPGLLERLAFTYHQIGEDSVCAELCEQVLELQPNNDTALKLRAQTLHGQNQHEAELNAYRDALAVSDQKTVIHHNLGTLLYQLGDWKQAETHLQTAYRGKDADSLNLILMIADCAFQSGEYGRALDYYKHVERSRPNDSDLLKAIGGCQWSLGEKAEARATFSRADQFAHRDSTDTSASDSAHASGGQKK